jgi:hypothetical protein
MNEALMAEESSLGKFAPDEEDLKWEECSARRFIVKKSHKWRHGFDNLDPDFIQVVEEFCASVFCQ